MVKKSDKPEGTRKPASVKTKTTVKKQSSGKNPIAPIRQLKTSGERQAYLASFPELNTNPILELDKKGNLLYQNPASRRILPDLPNLGLQHPFLADWADVIKRLFSGNLLKPLVREISFGKLTFEQVIYAVGKNRIRIYARDITKRTKVEAALNASEQNFRNSMDASIIGIVISDKEDQIYYANQALLQIFGYKNIEELQQKPTYNFYAPASRKEFNKRRKKLLLGKPLPEKVEADIALKNGTIRHVEVSHREVIWNGQPLYQTLFNDITESHRLMLQVQELNDVQTLVTRINQLIVETDDEVELLQKACDAFVANRRYALVWVGFAQVDFFKVIPVAKAGEGSDYLSSAKITWDDSITGRGPTGTAIKTGKSFLVKNIPNHPKYKPWQKDASQTGFKSSLALPLKIRDKVVGALNIYSKADGVFDKKELRLLEELTSDLSLGIEKIRQREEQQQLENTLRQNEARLREAQEMAHLGFWDWDIKTGKVHWSEEVFKIFHIDPNKFTPTINSVLDMSPWPEDHRRDKELIKKATESHTPGAYEQKFLRPDGSVGHYYSNFQGIYDDNGNLVSMVGTILDITERKKAEEALTEERDKAKKYLDVAEVLILSLDTEGNVNLINRRGCEILGYSSDEIIGKNWVSNFIPVDYREDVLDVENHIVSGHSELVRRHENPVLTKSGQERIIAWNNVELRDENGNVIGTLASGEDITERRQAEEALVASEKNFHNSMDNSPVGIRIADNQDGTLYANRAFLKLFDYADLEELEVTPPLKRYTPAAFADFLVRGKRRESGKPAPDSVDIEIVHKNGEIRHLRLFTRELMWYGKQQYQNLYIDITQQKHAEIALKTYEQNFRNSLDNSPVGVRIVDENWNTLYANQVFLEIHGYSTTAELDAVKPEKLFPPAEYERYLERRKKHARGEPEPGKLELDIIRKDGTLRHIRVTRSEVVWDDETRYQVVYQDITESKKTEAALKVSEENFRTSIDNSPIGIYITDLEWRPSYANRAFLDIFGYKTFAEISATPPHQFYTAESYEGLFERQRKSLKGDLNPRELEVDIRSRDGEIRHLQIFRKVINWDDRQQYLLFYIDLTERKKIEQELKASEEKYSTLIEQSTDIILILKDRKIEFANLRMYEMTGYSPPEVLGKYFYELTAPEYRKLLDDIYHRRSEGEETSVNHEMEIVTKNGTKLPVETKIRPIIYQGSPAGMLIVHDITERKQTEEVLRLSEQNFRTSIDNSPVGIRIVDQEWNTLYANKVFLNIFGYVKTEEVSSHPLEDHYPPEEAARSKIRKEAIARGDPVQRDIEVDIIRNDGARRHLQVFLKETFWNGKPEHQIIYNDITERQKAEDALKLSEQNFRNSMDNSVVGIRISDNRDNNLYANQAMLEIFGYKNIEEIQAHPPQDFYAPPDHAAWVQRHEKFVRGEPMPRQIEINIIRPDGKMRNLQVSMKDVFWNGESRYQTLYTDITDLKQAEEEKYESEAKYRIIVESTHDLIFSVNSENKYVYVSPSVKNMLGYEPEEIIGKLFISLVHPDDRHIIEEETQRSLAPGYKISEDIEYRIRHASGEWRWVVSRGTRVVDIHGNFLYFSGIARDTTEHKQAEEEKRHLEEKAQISSRLAAVGEMAAGIAHEINNPLTGVLGFSQMTLEKDNIPEDIRENLILIADGSRRVADIVKRLLTFARQSKPVKTLASINELVENTLKMREYVLKTSNIEVVMSLDPDLPWSVVDPGQMQQVFLNMIVNAEQAMKKAHGKGTLTITTKKMNDFIRISFVDDGPGITSENLKHLFEPFFTTKGPGEGTGLGLSLSHAIVLEHAGRINVSSNYGSGAAFIVEIPIIEDLTPDNEIPDKNLEMTAPASKTGRILVVDDEQGVRALVEKVLAKIGHQVESVADAGSAKDKIDSKELYDVIITDVRMPGINGIELYAWIIEKAPIMKNRFIFITGDVMGQDIKSFLAENNLPFLSKPFAVESLKDQVNRIMEIGPQ